MKTNKKTRWLVYAALLAMSAMLLTACSNPTPTPTAPTTPVAPQPLVIAQGVDATTLDPNFHSETPTGNVSNQIYDRLIGRDSDMNFEPALAVSWEPVTDTTWEIKLRDDVKFHDGVQFTSADVAYTLQRILDPEKKSSQAGNYSMISEVEVVDPLTIRFHTKSPFPILPSRLSTLRIVPKHYVESVGDTAFSTKPMGSGPYELVEWVKDERIVLKAFEGYWGGAPAVKDVIFKPIPEPASRVMALQAGEVDIIVNVPPYQAASLNSSPNAAAVSVPSIRSIFIPLIPHDGSPTADPLVRRALNMAVNVDSIVANLLEGNGTAMTQALANTEFGYHPDLARYPFDLEEAKALLVQAGYPNGFSLRFLAPSGRYMMDKEVAEAVKNQLEALGITVDLVIQEWGVYVQKLLSRTVDADIFLIGWSSGIFDADGTLYSWFHTGQSFGYYQMGPEKEAYMDNLLDTARGILDSAEREALYHEALSIIHEDAAWIPLYQQKDIYGVSNRVAWAPRADESIVVFEASWK
ncbi:MAG TPA: ABC transporter substrate-binding protein [Bacillota bacterium]|nr:ABC transporter substrate-binding protein [Bacillota bacterium]